MAIGLTPSVGFSVGPSIGFGAPEALGAPEPVSAVSPQVDSALGEAAAAVRDWARAQASASLAQVDDSVGSFASLLMDVQFAASAELRPQVWTESRLASALAEANIAANTWEERIQLAQVARAITPLAPTARLLGGLRRAELRILETLTGHPGARVAAGAVARIEQIIQDTRESSGAASGAASGGAHGFLTRLQRRLQALKPGSTMPRFLARDTAGNEVRSTLLTGQVTVLRFWSADTPASVLTHEQDARLLREFWDAPVALFGAAQSTERESHLAFLDECSFAGTQLFDGPISTALADELARAGDALVHGAGVSAPIGAAEAWHQPMPGALFVIDEHGVIRARDIPRNELRSLLHQLVKERRLRLRGELAAAGGPHR